MPSSRSVLAQTRLSSRVPRAARHHAVEDADVEVVLHVDRHRVDDRGRPMRAMGITAPRPQEHGLDRLEDDEEIERHRHVLDVEEVVLQLLHRVLDAGAVGVADLRPARSAPAARCAAGRRTGSPRVSCWTNSGRSGRGPTRLMSPLRMFQSCGSSSSRVRRRKRPTASRACRRRSRPDRRRCRASASARIERNLWTVNTRPCRPTRALRDRTPARAT